MRIIKVNSKYFLKLITAYLLLVLLIFILYRFGLEKQANKTANNNFNQLITYISNDLDQFKKDINNNNTNLQYDLEEGLVINEFYIDLINNELAVIYYDENNLKRYYYYFNGFNKYFKDIAENYLIIKKDGKIIYSENKVTSDNIVFYLKNSKKVDRALDNLDLTIKDKGKYISFKSIDSTYYLVEVIDSNYYIENYYKSILIYLVYVLIITGLIILSIKLYYLDNEKINEKINKTLIEDLKYINYFVTNKEGLIVDSNENFKSLFKVRPNSLNDLDVDFDLKQSKNLNINLNNKTYDFTHIITNKKHSFINTNYLNVILEQEKNLYFNRGTNLPNLKSFERDLENLSYNYLYLIEISDFEKLARSISDNEINLMINNLIKNIKETLNKNKLYQINYSKFILTVNEESDNKLTNSLNITKNEIFKTSTVNIDFIIAALNINIIEDNNYDNIIKILNLTNKHAREIKAKTILNYDKGIKKHYLELEQVEKDLYEAVLNDDFKLLYQPQLNLKTNKIESFESLIRWDNEKYRLITPEKFLMIAEESNLIYDFTTLVVEKTLKFLKKINNPKIKVAFNVSPKQFMQQGFVNKLLNDIDKHKINPNQIVVEITENVLIDSFEDVNNKIKSLRENGIEIHLDDFGSGYSSFKYLKDLAVDVLKVDRSFIFEMNNDNRVKNITKMIIELGHHLDLKVIAEGVETKQELNELKKMKCDYIQGFLVSKPLEEEDALNFLNKKLEL